MPTGATWIKGCFLMLASNPHHETSGRMSLSRALRFGIVGVTNTAISYVVFHFLMLLPFVALVYRTPASQAIAYTAGMVSAFILNGLWTFRTAQTTRAGLKAQSRRFIVAQMASLLLSVFLVTLFVDVFDFQKTLGWLCAMVFVTAANFCLSALWVFTVAKDAP